jgi:hypothetical protein
MRWKERLHIALPELVRPDKRALMLGLPLGTVGWVALSSAAGHVIDPHLMSEPALILLGFPAAKLLVWSSDLLSRNRLNALLVSRHAKAYRRGVEQVRKQRRLCHVPGRGFFPDLLRRRNSPLLPEDLRLLDRIELHVCQIEHQFGVLDPFLQRHLLHVLPQVVEQGTKAMEVGQKLVVLQEFLAKENPIELELEHQQFLSQARGAALGPVDTLHAQACRFKAQQIENLQKARQNAALYRAQLQAIEAGLGNVRGRMASISTLEEGQVGYEMEALDAELTAIQDGLEMASRVAGGEYPYARTGHGEPRTTVTVEDSPSPGEPPRPHVRQTQSG